MNGKNNKPKPTSLEMEIPARHRAEAGKVPDREKSVSPLPVLPGVKSAAQVRYGRSSPSISEPVNPAASGLSSIFKGIVSFFTGQAQADVELPDAASVTKAYALHNAIQAINDSELDPLTEIETITDQLVCPVDLSNPDLSDQAAEDLTDIKNTIGSMFDQIRDRLSVANGGLSLDVNKLIENIIDVTEQKFASLDESSQSHLRQVLANYITDLQEIRNENSYTVSDDESVGDFDPVDDKPKSLSATELGNTYGTVSPFGQSPQTPQTPDPGLNR